MSDVTGYEFLHCQQLNLGISIILISKPFTKPNYNVQLQLLLLLLLFFFQGTDTLSRKKQQKALKSVRYT